MRLILVQWLLYANSITAFSIPNVNATYSSSPKPFLINVSPEFINFTLDRVATSRFPIDVQQPDWTDGPPKSVASAVRDYWVSNYSWTDVQRSLNQRFKMFTTVVPATNKSRYDVPVPLHFVHHRSPRADAIPLLFMHGWPGNFLEVTNIIDGLTDPPSKDMPAFHVVAPSLPGFGFSPAPTKPGMGSEAAGEAFNGLMMQLNYTKYVIQAGDLGGFISRWLAHNHPESVVSLVSNFWLSPPNNRDIERYALGLSTADEAFVIQEYASRVASDTGFSTEQQTQPLQLAYGMSDSPMGLAMWLYDVMHAVVQHYVFPLEQIITWTHMYWIQGPVGGFRFYKENQQDGVINNGLSDLSTFPFVEQPVAISQFPLDFWYRTPIDWAQRTGNVVRRTVHDSGGHFAAVESPEALLADIRSFFGNETLSHTYVFRH